MSTGTPIQNSMAFPAGILRYSFCALLLVAILATFEASLFFGNPLDGDELHLESAIDYILPSESAASLDASSSSTAEHQVSQTHVAVTSDSPLASASTAAIGVTGQSSLPVCINEHSFPLTQIAVAFRSGPTSSEPGCSVSGEFDARILQDVGASDGNTYGPSILRVFPAISGKSLPTPTGIECLFETCQASCVVSDDSDPPPWIDSPWSEAQIATMRPAHARDIGCVRFQYRVRRLTRMGGGITIPTVCTIDSKIRASQLAAHKPPAPFTYGSTTIVTDEVRTLPYGCIGFGRSARGAPGTRETSDESCDLGCTVLFNSTTYFSSPQLAKPKLIAGTVAQRLDYGIAIDAPWYDSWQHFILDGLSLLGPALPLIRRDRRVRVLVPSYNKMQRKWFELLGISKQIVVARRLGKRTLFYCGRNMMTVLRASAPGESHHGPYRSRKSCSGTAAISETARALLPPLAPDTRPLAIYVSRKGKSRIPPNERAILALIEERLRANNRTEKLVVFVGHEHTFEEQLRTFQSATLIIGSQGGGHVARVVAPLGAVNIQFSPAEPRLRNAFKSMMYGDAGCRFLSYHVVTDRQFRVPLGDLRLTLDLALHSAVDTNKCLRF
jgi:hypothetical protein